MAAAALPAADVLGVDVAVGTVESAAHAVIARALSGEGGHAVLCNVHVLMTARKHRELLAALHRAWAVFPDGAPVAWMQRRLGCPEAERVGGPDLMPAVLDRGRERGLRHAFVGSTQDVLDRLVATMEGRYPGVEIVLALAPAPGAEDDPATLAAVRAASPHVVWVALGAPKQELWMARTAAALTPALLVGVGAAFDFHAGTKARAPGWMQQAGLEWLHRLA
ncbi:MAG TPA: WecB/TagA/CpsF family glycosyltransferase, partial [Gaiellaceae bacterium]|nr:WecB/TagA/CpsF family glycosyltransferase [Gaiellaceae bacterium]